MEEIKKIHEKMDNLACALDKTLSALAQLAVDYSATGHMSDTVGKQITTDLYIAYAELCEYREPEKKPVKKENPEWKEETRWIK